MKYIPFLLLSCFLNLIQCSRDTKVMLEFDSSSTPVSHYYLDARISGSIASTDTVRQFSTSTQCTLQCKNDMSNPKYQETTISSIRINSDILGNNEIQNLLQQAHNTRLLCNLQDGIISSKDSSDIPFVRIGEWNLVKNLIKTIPALPKIKIQRGATWERERNIPLQTRHGKAIGHLLQSFSLDSLYTGKNAKRFALVRWKFSYQLEMQASQSPGILDEIPSKGQGTGSALLCISDKKLEKTSVNFSVASTHEGTYKIAWNETITLTATH